DDYDQQGDDERTESDDNKSVDLNKIDDEEETQEDEFVHTPDDYVPTDDETHDVDDEEYDHINEEMYDDVNVELKDPELAGKGKGDEEITNAEKVNAELKRLQVLKFRLKLRQQLLLLLLRLQVPVDLFHPTMTSSLLPIHVLVIPEPSVIKPIPKIVTAAPATNIPPPIHLFISHSQQSTPILTSTTVEATTSTTAILESRTLSVVHQRVFDLEKEVKILRNVDHKSAIRAAIKSEVPVVVKECLGTNLEDSLHKVIRKQTANFIREHTVPAAVVTDQETKYTITSSDKASLKEFDQKRTLFETMTKSKSFDRNPKHGALYHALMESILEDEDAMDKGVAEKLKKRKPDDADRDEDPPAGPDQGLKRRKTHKDAKPSMKVKSTDTSKSTTKS
ncbi:hypothetical protein Tco_0507950, partial [Tanacetum coccineum]